MSDFKTANSMLSVTLTKNPFSAEDTSYVGRVTRNTVTLENLIASISEKDSGVSPYMIQHVANLLGKEMLIATQNGKAVDVLGLGTMFISLDGTLKSTNPTGANIPEFKLGFTPSSKAQDTVKLLKADKFVYAVTNPAIDTIVNTYNQAEDSVLMKGKGVRITGHKLRIMGSDSGVWFAPLNSEGNAEKDETKWISVSGSTISINKPKTLEFYVPEEVVSGTSYCLVLRTRYCSGSKELKNIAETFSNAITISD